MIGPDCWQRKKIMRRVFNYKDLRRLEESIIYQRLQKGVIITATSDLAKEIANYYPTTQTSAGLPVIDVHRVTGSMIEVWDKKVKDIRNYVELRNLVEEFIETNDLSEIHRAYLRRNSADIWNAIVLLVEADVYPDDIPDNLSPPVRDFKYLWKQIEIENQAFMQFRSTFLFELTDKEYLEAHLPKEIQGKELFLLGFYYITPIQARIIAALEAAGYTVNYLNGYDPAHPFVFEIWEKTFAEEYKKKATIDIQPFIRTDNRFIESIEKIDTSGTTDRDNVFVRSYKTDIEFATACMKAKQSGAVLYTTDPKRTDALLREFYPEEYDDKHLLSYPVGQYIYYLHMLWNEFIEEPELQYEYVFKCFASGWLEEDGVNGKEYLYQLKILEPYFKNCNVKGRDSFEEWKKRAGSLLGAKRMTAVFDEGNDSRWKRLLGNPFNNMAIYQLKEVEIEAIIQLIDRLIADANALFCGDKTKNLYSHMQKIQKIIASHADKDDITEDERSVMKELLDRLGGAASKGVVCHLNGIKDAILLLIGDHHETEESYEDETSEKKRLVKPISMIEASTLANYGQEIHLVMADEFLLPGRPRKLPWPLSDELIETLIKKLSVDRPESAEYVKAMVNLIKTRPLANRYLFSSLFDNIANGNRPNIYLSWILKQGEREVAASPYISLMGKTERDKEDNERELYLREMVREVRSDTTQDHIHIPAPDADEPLEVKGDHALCKMRYLYSYIFNPLPCFSSEFHYSFVLSNMVAAFATISGEDKNVISEQIRELFPFFRKVERQQATDHARGYRSEDTEFDGVWYTGNRLDVHYLQTFIKRSAEKNASRSAGSGDLPWKVESENCKYCPYTDICRVKFEGVAKYGS